MSEPLPTKAEAMAMMEMVLNDPLNVKGRESQRIVAFCSDSAVEIVIAPSYVPWTEDSLHEDLSAMLLLAYVSGNALAQLKAGKSGDDFRAGMRGALHVYKQLKPQGVVSKKLEELLALEARGELEAHFNQIELKQPASAAQ